MEIMDADYVVKTNDEVRRNRRARAYSRRAARRRALKVLLAAAALSVLAGVVALVWSICTYM